MRALLEHTQQQRDILRDSAPVPSLPETTSSEEIGQCFELRHIRLENVTVLPRSAQKKLMAIPPEGCMTIRHIQQRVRDVTQDYLSRGFITSSAWLPEQDISGGNLVIAVTEGKVETVTLDGYQENALKMALPKIKGKILNLRDIEQGLEQLNRLTSRSLTVDILPGSREGFSRLELVPVSQRFPVSLDVGVDNSGQKSTGSRQINSRLTVDNLLSLADQWTLSAGRDSEFHHDRRSRSVLAGVSIPYGYWLFSAQYAWSDFYQTLSVGESPQRWRYGGSVQSQRLAASRTLLRDGKQRLALDMALSRRQTENRLGGIRLDVSSPTLSSVTAGLSYSRSIGGGYLTFGPSLSHGVSLAGATRDDPAHPDLPRSEFRRFSASTSWFYPITPSLYWLTSAYGQTTPDRLYASEQLSVGGLYSVIEAKKNATLTSTNGKVNFLAVKNTTFEQTVSTSKGFYIKQANKGYSEGKWVLPSVHAGGKLTVNAASGVSADVKAKNGQALQGAVAALSALPGTEWLKGLNTRSDVQWNTVKDAYDSWNYKNQSLNPAVAAVIAIAAAAVTAGSSLAATVATSVTSTVGGGVVTTGAVTAGMSSLAAQAAVALVENQGNLSKTLSALGSSSSVKSLATSMVIGGALVGFDKVMNIDVSPDKARLPALVKNEGWGKIVQRVAGQSVISSSLNTAINGGSFKDNLTNALLANIGNQINAEGAGLIGDNGEILDLPGRALSHAVVAGISAEIGRGDGKGAAAGALAAELAGVIMQSSLFEPANQNERERQLLRLQEALNGNEAKEQTARVIGALTGALITHTPEGTYSGADSAQNVYRYNMTEHMLQQYALDNQRDILAASKGDTAAAKRVQARREAAAMVAITAGGGLAVTAGGLTILGAAPEIVLAARLIVAGCKSNPALCLNQAGIYAADIIAPEAIIGVGPIAAGSTLFVGKSSETTKKLAWETIKSADNTLKNSAFNIQPVADLIKKEVAVGSVLPKKNRRLFN